jgi:hypothetical protein
MSKYTVTEVILKEGKKEPEKLKLVACLQDSEKLFFYKSNWEGTLKAFDKAILLAESVCQGMDLIKLTRVGGQAIFLGYWNNGVI